VKFLVDARLRYLHGWHALVDAAFADGGGPFCSTSSRLRLTAQRLDGDP
jgi:hypothetical protein